MDNGKELFAYDVCTKHEADYEQIIQCNDCAVYTNSHHADMERQRIGDARREAANEVIKKIRAFATKTSDGDYLTIDRTALSYFLDSLSNQYKNEPKQ